MTARAPSPLFHAEPPRPAPAPDERLHILRLFIERLLTKTDRVDAVLGIWLSNYRGTNDLGECMLALVFDLCTSPVRIEIGDSLRIFAFPRSSLHHTFFQEPEKRLIELFSLHWRSYFRRRTDRGFADCMLDMHIDRDRLCARLFAVILQGQRDSASFHHVRDVLEQTMHKFRRRRPDIDMAQTADVLSHGVIAIVAGKWDAQADFLPPLYYKRALQNTPWQENTD